MNIVYDLLFGSREFCDWNRTLAEAPRNFTLEFDSCPEDRIAAVISNCIDAASGQCYLNCDMPQRE